VTPLSEPPIFKAKNARTKHGAPNIMDADAMSTIDLEATEHGVVPDKDFSPLQTARTKTPSVSVDGYKVVCVRLRTAEFEQFASDVEASGLTNSMALRIAARRIGGFLEIDGEVRNNLENLIIVIGSLSKAVRDLHDICLAGGVVTVQQLDDQQIIFGSAFAQLDGMLRSILNVSQRRADGRSLMIKALSG
jgi:type IV secretion system T-DNA border endonuclease VirD1